MPLFKGLFRALARCWRGAAADENVGSMEGDAAVRVTTPTDKPHTSNKPHHPHPHHPHKPHHHDDSDRPLVPEVFTKHYAKVIPHDVTAKEAVCLTSDVAVLGDAAIKGDNCITGNVLIAGSARAKGGLCITGDAIVLGSVHLVGQVTVTGDAFVGGDLAVRGKLDVGGKLCVFGSKDIQPDA